MKITLCDNGTITTIDNVKEIKEIDGDKIDIDYKPNKCIIRGIRVSKGQILTIEF